MSSEVRDALLGRWCAAVEAALEDVACDAAPAQAEGRVEHGRCHHRRQARLDRASPVLHVNRSLGKRVVGDIALVVFWVTAAVSCTSLTLLMLGFR